MTAHNLDSAYRHCERLARSHYENFPVASWLLPRALRRPVAVLYAFARTADDFADEGHYSAAQRLALLNGYSERLQRIERGERVDEPLFIALADVMTRHQLPAQLFHDLLSAFTQDVTKKRYADFAELLDYCRRSANPVGRLLLHLSGNASAQNLQLSDQVCSALQLINFYQDLLQDFEENERIYIPEDEMRRHYVGSEHFAVRSDEREMVELFRFQIERARRMLEQGRPLGRRLKGRFGLEIRLIIEGGLAVVARLEQSAEKPFSRPRLRRSDWLRALWRAL
jgi:squalene synthase HpnC